MARASSVLPVRRSSRAEASSAMACQALPGWVSGPSRAWSAAGSPLSIWCCDPEQRGEVAQQRVGRVVRRDLVPEGERRLAGRRHRPSAPRRAAGRACGSPAGPFAATCMKALAAASRLAGSPAAGIEIGLEAGREIGIRHPRRLAGLIPLPAPDRPPPRRRRPARRRRSARRHSGGAAPARVPRGGLPPLHRRYRPRDPLVPKAGRTIAAQAPPSKPQRRVNPAFTGAGQDAA